MPLWIRSETWLLSKAKSINQIKNTMREIETMKRFCTFSVILIALSCGLNIAFAQEVSIHRVENTPEVSLVGQVLKYRIDIDDAASLTGASLTWSAPGELINIESI